jgi:hypothetical protein
MGGYNAELERDYCVFILDNNFISNMEIKVWQHVRVNSPICLSITSKDSFPYKENKRRQVLKDFLCCLLSFLLQDFLPLKEYCEMI